MLKWLPISSNWHTRGAMETQHGLQNCSRRCPAAIHARFARPPARRMASWPLLSPPDCSKTAPGSTVNLGPALALWDGQGCESRGGNQVAPASEASRVFLRRRRENFGILKRFQRVFLFFQPRLSFVMLKLGPIPFD